MKPYHKIKNVFKRDVDNGYQLMLDTYTIPEFELLKDINWLMSEKIDGTNIRIMWDGQSMKIGGRTDRAQIPVTLFDRIGELMDDEKWHDSGLEPLCLYGEGFGAGIQKGGAYMPEGQGVSFRVFDIRVGDWWLDQEDVIGIAGALGLNWAPRVSVGNLAHAVELCRGGFGSYFSAARAEGLILRPKVQLFTRGGDRIIAKLKCKDFK